MTRALHRLPALIVAVALAAPGAFAEPRPWTVGNLDPNGGGTPVLDPFGTPLAGEFAVHLVLDNAEDGPDPVIAQGDDLGLPGGDDQLAASAVVTAPADGLFPAGGFSLFLVYDDATQEFYNQSFYVRVHEGATFSDGSRFVNSAPFNPPQYAGSAQTVAEFPEGMPGYVGNEPPEVTVTPAGASVAAGGLLELQVEIYDDEPAAVSVPVPPELAETISIEQPDGSSAVVTWAVPLQAAGEIPIPVVASDGELSTREIVTVDVLEAEPRPSAFQLLSPDDGATAWEGETLDWQASNHPLGFEVTYTFTWSLDEDFAGADSVTGLVETGINLFYAEDANRPTVARNRGSDPGTSAHRPAVARNRGSDPGTSAHRPAVARNRGSDTSEDRGENTPRRTPVPIDGDDPVILQTDIDTEIPVGETFYWRVRAEASDGSERISAARAAVAERPDPPEPFSLLAPADGALLVTTEPAFSWNSASDPDIGDTLRYDLIWSPDGGAEWDTVFAIPDTSFDMGGDVFNLAGAGRLRDWLEQRRGNQQLSRGGGSAVADDPRGRAGTEPLPLTLVKDSQQVGLRGGRSGARAGVHTRSDHGTNPLPLTLVKDSQQVGLRGGRPGARAGVHTQSDDPRGRARTAGTGVSGEPETDDVPDDSEITWFVDAVDATGLRASSNETRSFTVDAPEPPAGFDPISPADSLFIRHLATVPLSWTPAADPDPGEDVAYDVLATTDPAEFPVIAPGLADTSAELPADESDDVEWRWTVRAVSSGDTVWINGGPFRLFVSHRDPPDPFALVSPADSAQIVDQSPELEWEQSADADLFDSLTYSVHWSTDAWQSADSLTGLTETTVELAEFADETTVWWKVRAADTNTRGRWAAPAAGRSFTIHIEDPPLPFDLLAPDSGTVVEQSPIVFRWSESEDPEQAGPLGYVVEIAVDSSFTDPELIDAGADTTAAIETWNLGAGEYLWRVIATDASELSTPSTQTWPLTVPASSVTEFADDLPREFAIARAYPNPFNPVVTLVVAIPKPGARVELTLHDVLGREVVRREWTSARAGYRPLPIDLTGHATGAYFVNLSADGRPVETRRVTYLK
ncbi:MAG: hypothetical protein MAG453_01366 [Calditrichaeota bacterium]|nr:hypothetical protein [Calditrichota bacterium]